MNQSRRQQLAQDLAEGLNDRAGFEVFLSYTYKYPEGVLRAKLAEALAMPAHKITRNRAAYFTNLLQREDRKHRYHYDEDRDNNWD